MVAKRNAEVERLNATARELLRAEGQLGAQEIEVGEARFAAGDQVITRVNDHAAAIYNRERWQVAGGRRRARAHGPRRASTGEAGRGRPRLPRAHDSARRGTGPPARLRGDHLLRPGHHRRPRLRDGRSLDGQARRSTSPPRAVARRPTSTPRRRSRPSAPSTRRRRPSATPSATSRKRRSATAPRRRRMTRRCARSFASCRARSWSPAARRCARRPRERVQRRSAPRRTAAACWSWHRRATKTPSRNAKRPKVWAGASAGGSCPVRWNTSRDALERATNTRGDTVIAGVRRAMRHGVSARSPARSWPSERSRRSSPPAWPRLPTSSRSWASGPPTPRRPRLGIAGVTGIETYRHEHGINDAGSALGPPARRRPRSHRPRPRPRCHPRGPAPS